MVDARQDELANKAARLGKEGKEGKDLTPKLIETIKDKLFRATYERYVEEAENKLKIAKQGKITRID